MERYIKQPYLYKLDNNALSNDPDLRGDRSRKEV